MASRFSVESVFRLIDKVTAPVSKMQSRLRKFTRSVNRGFRNLNRSLNKFGRGLKRASVAGALSLALLTGAMVNVIGTGAEFEQTLVTAAAKFPGEIRKGTEAFEELGKVARKTGATTEFTATQAAEGLNFLALAGFNAEQSIAALPAIVNLATAAQTDLSTASDIATDSLGAFGLATKDTTQLGKNLARINDVLAKTSTTANTSVEQMFEAIVKGAPDFTSAGQTIETFSALVGALADSGKKGSEAGTALRNMMLRLAAPSKEAGKVLKKLGIRVSDADGNFRDAIDILADFEKATINMGDTQRTAALSTIFGARTVGSMNILLKKGADSLRTYRETLEGAGGASEDMATVMRDTLQGRINAAISAFEGLKITLLSLKDTAVGGVIEGFTEFVRKIDEAITANQDLSSEMIDGIIKTALGLIGVFGQLVLVFAILKTATIAWGIVTTAATLIAGAYNTAIAFGQGLLGRDVLAKNASRLATIAWSIGAALATAAQWALNIAMTANPIGLLIVGIGLLIAGGILLVKNWDFIVESFGKAVDLISSFLSFLLTPIKLLVEGLAFIFGGAAKLGIIGGDEGEAADVTGTEGTQVLTPSERIAREVEERRETSTVGITVKAEEGTSAEVSQKGSASGVSLSLVNSGVF